MSDDAVQELLTRRALEIALQHRVWELERTLKHLDRHTLDLYLYAQSLPAQPDRYEWSVVVDLIREVRDAYGLRTPNR